VESVANEAQIANPMTSPWFSVEELPTEIVDVATGPA